jgi:hypothetical protein
MIQPRQVHRSPSNLFWLTDAQMARLFHPVANSFAEFIAMLGPEPEDD